MWKGIFFILTLFNLAAWFYPSAQVGFNFENLLPLFSIIATIIWTYKSLFKKSIKITILQFVVLGILFHNIPWYLISLVDESEITSILTIRRISAEFFIKSNYLIGISLPLICLGYHKIFNIRSKRHKIYLPNRMLAFYLAIAVMVLSISENGFIVGSLFTSGNSYWYILAQRLVCLVMCIYGFTYLHSNRLHDISKPILPFINSTRKALLLCLIFICYCLIGGDRGPVMTIVAIILFCYLIVQKFTISRFALNLLLILGVLLVNVFFIVEILRMSEQGQSFNIDMVSNVNVNEYSSFGFSQLCTCLAIEGIDHDLYPNTCGFFLVQSFLRGTPFIGNKLLELLAVPTMFSDGSAELLSIQYLGLGHTWGVGTTYIADLYIEFGLIGVIIGSLLIGLFTKYIDTWITSSNKNSFSMYTLAAFLAGYSIYIGRSTVTSFAVNYIHAMIIYYFLIRVPSALFCNNRILKSRSNAI